MNLELVSIETDTIPLDGIFYTPSGPIRSVAMFFHGNCHNFYEAGLDVFGHSPGSELGKCRIC